MHFDFELLLVILTLVTGVVWGWDRWRFRHKRAEQPEAKSEEDVPWWIDMPRSLFPVILAVLVIRSFLVEPFRIPSGSMIPTLFAGDFILVNKFTYGIRLPAVNWKVVELNEPERGDVVVFRFPRDLSQDYIKRVIGVPGDEIVYRNKQLFINGEAVEQVPMGAYYGPETEDGAQIRLENLGDVEHQILIHNDPPRSPFRVKVPAGQYFVMGDNRDRSHDSRFWGFVPEENLVGKAFLIWMSWDPQEMGINWSRIGDAIE